MKMETNEYMEQMELELREAERKKYSNPNVRKVEITMLQSMIANNLYEIAKLEKENAEYNERIERIKAV